MKPHKSIIYFILTFTFLLIISCSIKKEGLYSYNQYTPIPKVEIDDYKSPQLRANQDAEKTIGLAISGGGSRAQYFGLGVLIGLDDIKIGECSFLNEVDYISTVSGGGFAAGYYMSMRYNNVLDNYNSLYDYWKSDVRKDSLTEFLFKPASALTIMKLPRYEKNKIKKPYPEMIDYELLQYPKSYDGKKIKRLYLSDFFIPKESEKNVVLPMFVANGTIYNNGERIPFMPHIIDSIGINGSLLPPEQFDFIDKRYDVPLAYAIAGSAAFPGVLPMLKMSIKNKPDSVVRIIDGGVVDNLGFTTLFELLDGDLNKNENKAMLIVDCGGLGSKNREQNTDRVKVQSLLTTSLLYTVEVKLLYSNSDIEVLTKYYDLDKNNIKRIGLNTIKEKYIELVNNSDDQTRQDLSLLKNSNIIQKRDWKKIYKDIGTNTGKENHIEPENNPDAQTRQDTSSLKNNNIKKKMDWKGLYKDIGINTFKGKSIEPENTSDSQTEQDMSLLKNKKVEKKVDWKDLYIDLANSQAFREYNEDNLSELPMDRFSEFTTLNVFQIFELAAQVVTKIKIFPWEKEILILAGRYTVYLEREAINKIAN